MGTVYSVLKGHGPPSSSTPGSVGQEYVDTDNGVVYECIEAFCHKGYKFSKEFYTWKVKGVDMDMIATDQEVEVAIDDLREELSGGVTPSMEGVVFAEFVE